MTESPPRAGAMRWVSAHSALPDTAAAVDQVIAALATGWDGASIDLAIVFFSAAHVGGVQTITDRLRAELSPGCLIGASAHGVVTTDHEIESVPALTVMAARLPGVDVRPFLVVNEAWEAAAEDPLEFARCAPGVQDAEIVMLLGDPFTLDIERCLGAFDRHAKGVRVVGGLASAGVRPGSNALFLNDWSAREGGVAVALAGALRVDVVVSQGCRPIGPAIQVTRAQGNVLFELDGQPALERAEQVLRGLPDPEKERLRNGLYVGRPVRTDATGQGDYLIRNLMGADRDRGVLAVGDHIPQGEKIRLHVRDADTAREDLEMMLSPQVFDARASAALLFACNGRGQGLYGTPDGDISVLQDSLGGGVPAAGMFCAGEIGPVGGRHYLHGHTASIAIVRAPAPSG